MWESEADYNASMQAYAEAEAQAQQEYEYQCYLDNLIATNQFYLYALEICQDLLNSRASKESGLSPVEYLAQEKTRITTRKEKVEEEVDIF